ncbi:MAG: sugar phosphate isomerase/epimerase [Clostridia bacterium]|nr:sugar phosphate isomerase/epimerase [Clostridia bacterium]
MLWGMPTLIENEGVEECAKLCETLDLDFIELNMNLLEYQTEKIDVDFFNSIAKRYNVKYTIHLDENFNACDFNPYVSKAYLRTLKDTLDIARLLGASVINMHLSRGVYFTMPDKKIYLFEKYSDRYLASVLAFRDFCENEIGKDNIKICIENTNGYEDFQKSAIDIMLESEVFGLTFDIGHNRAIGGRDEEFIAQRSERLRHFHIHDATLGRDHITLGKGDMDIKRYIKWAENLGASAVIETKTVRALSASCEYIKTL